MRQNVLVLAPTGLLVWPSAGPARLDERWDYDRLLKEADLVVIAVPERTEATVDKPPAHSWAHEFVGQNTSFVVKSALKGKAGGEKITLLHVKFGELKKGIDPDSFDAKTIIDGPRLVVFPTGTVGVAPRGAVVEWPSEYLLFLRRMKDGRHEPVAGQIDSSVSVRVLTAASNKVSK